MHFSKWIKWEDLLHLDWHSIVPNTRLTKERFIKRITHRSILDVELLLDVDTDFIAWENALERKTNLCFFPSVELKSKWIFKKLKSLGFDPVAYKTGSKGYHISLIMAFLRDMDIWDRKLLKEQVMEHYGADLQKANERVLIALEGNKHWKSGKIKEEVEW